jgi:signal peptidase I
MLANVVSSFKDPKSSSYQNTSLNYTQTAIENILILHIMLGSMSPRGLLLQLLNFAFIMSTAFMMWKGLSVAADSPSPIVVVLSGSMEPAFQRGDLLFLWNRWYPTGVADIVVYKVKDKEIPIVHRVISTHDGG